MSLRRPLAKPGPYSLRSAATRVLPCFLSMRPLLSRWRPSRPRLDFAMLPSCGDVGSISNQQRLIHQQTHAITTDLEAKIAGKAPKAPISERLIKKQANAFLKNTAPDLSEILFEQGH